MKTQLMCIGILVVVAGVCAWRALSVPKLDNLPFSRQETEYLKQEKRQDEELDTQVRSGCGSNETVVTLRRTPGLNWPRFALRYDLAVCGDGTVVYRGYGCLHVTGVQTKKIDPTEVQNLVQSFVRANYFGIADQRLSITDSSGAYTSLTLGNRRKSVADYPCCAQGLKQLEDLAGC